MIATKQEQCNKGSRVLVGKNLKNRFIMIATNTGFIATRDQESG